MPQNQNRHMYPMELDARDIQTLSIKGIKNPQERQQEAEAILKAAIARLRERKIEQQ